MGGCEESVQFPAAITVLFKLDRIQYLQQRLSSALDLGLMFSVEKQAEIHDWI